MARALFSLSITAVSMWSLFLSCNSIQVGDKLSVKQQQPWLSANGNFAFGFSEVATATGKFSLAIWYSNTRKILWEATLDNGVATKERAEVSRDGQLDVSASAGLVLADRDQKPVWNTTLVGCTNNCSTVAGASLEDNGNFVLRDRSNNVLWQSFSSPTDTLLPGQDLIGDMSLVSGRYRLRMSKTSLGLYYDGFPANESYWSVVNKDLNVSDPSLAKPLRLVFNQNGSLEFFDANGSSWNHHKYDNAQRYPIDYGNSSVLRRLTLERNGTLRSYSMLGSDERVVWQSLLQECDVFGTCGDFGLCKYEPRKSCSCPPGFHKTRPADRSDAANFSGCSYNFASPESCSSTNQSKMIEMARADVLGAAITTNSRSSVSLETCKKLCLEDCQCVAATYKLGTAECIVRTRSYPFSIVQSAQKASIFLVRVAATDKFAAADSDWMHDLFVTKMDAGGPGEQLIRTTNKSTKFFTTSRAVVFAVAVGEFLVLCGFVAAAILWWKSSNRKTWMKIVKDRQGPTRFTYEQLEAATGNFRDMLGSGGFGSVYRGVLPDQTQVAVKTLQVATHGEKQFQAEVATLGKIHHVNLVKLIGYCAEGNHRVLVYEYMSNRSLDKVLAKSDANNWKTRCSIAVGIARGMAYLHEECYECILHCDIKPQNILLDDKLCPKVADFGLAKLTKPDLALNVTTIRGTRGYLAPEWISNRAITPKVDVFSFGMVLLEVLIGCNKSRSTTNVSAWAFQKYTAEEMESIIDPELVETVDWNQFERMLKTAFWCIQLDANLRPTMSRIVQMLDDYNSDVKVPPFPISLDQETGTNSNSMQSVLEGR